MPCRANRYGGTLSPSAKFRRSPRACFQRSSRFFDFDGLFRGEISLVVSDDEQRAVSTKNTDHQNVADSSPKRPLKGFHIS